MAHKPDHIVAKVVICAFFFALLITGANSGAQNLAPQAALEPARVDALRQVPFLVTQVRSGNPIDIQKAVQQIRLLPVRAMSDVLPQLLVPLIDAKQFDVLEELAVVAIADKAYDIGTVQNIQRARVQALVDQHKFDQALIEAKSYFNIVALKDTGNAIALLSEIWTKAGDPGASARFKFEQISYPTSSAIGASQEPTSQPNEFDLIPMEGFNTALKEIKSNPNSFKEPLRLLEGRRNSQGLFSSSNLLARGNLLLLADRAFDARRVFEMACSVPGSAKAMRESVEGVARAIRAQSGGSSLANKFVMSVRTNPSSAIPSLAAGIDTNLLKIAAEQIQLASVQVMSPPSMEMLRAAEANSTIPSPNPIKISTDFETGKPVNVRWYSRTHVAVSIAPKGGQNWFIFRMEGVKGETIRVDLTDPQTPLNNWVSFNPVCISTENILNPACFSSLEHGAKTSPVAAWNGLDVLLPDTSMQKWQYLPNVWRVDDNTMAFVTKFEEDVVYIGMRIPYTPSFNEAILKKFSSNPAAELIEIGKSRHGRPLILLKIGLAEDASARVKPCVFLYAGEHADEYDGMWVVNGAAEFLLSENEAAKQLRDHFRFLLIPMLDPDQAAAGLHEGMVMTFLSDIKTPESTAYANWFQNWVNGGNRLDVVINIHNVQSLESGHVATALIEGLGERGDISARLSRATMEGFRALNLTTNSAPWGRGWSPQRLGGWLSRRYGPPCFAYEVNSQAPNGHLNLRDLKNLGSVFVKESSNFLESPDGAKLLANVDLRRAERSARWARADGRAVEGLDAINAEGLVSKGVGVSESDNPLTEKWVP